MKWRGRGEQLADHDEPPWRIEQHDRAEMNMS